jgi:hypothetical protein
MAKIGLIPVLSDYFSRHREEVGQLRTILRSIPLPVCRRRSSSSTRA